MWLLCKTWSYYPIKLSCIKISYSQKLNNNDYNNNNINTIISQTFMQQKVDFTTSAGFFLRS
jgi:hypothetical protein